MFFYEVCVVEDRRSMAEKATDLSSQKGKRKRSYTMEFKRQVVVYANENSNRSAAYHYGLEPNRVKEWKKDIDKIKETKSSKQRLHGGGRKCTDEELEQELIHWQGVSQDLRDDV